MTSLPDPAGGPAEPPAAVGKLDKDPFDDYRRTLADAVTGLRPGRATLDQFREVGAQAATEGTPLAAVVGSYLQQTGTAWPTLPGVRDAVTATDVRAAGSRVLTAVETIMGALATGHQIAGRDAARHDDRVRQEFIEDLLDGRITPTSLAERAERFGVLLAGRNVVTVARSPTGFNPDHPVLQRVEDAFWQRFGSRNILFAVRDSVLVCIASSALRGTAGELAHHLLTTLGTQTQWRIGVGRPHAGPAGVLRSFTEARDALDLADRLGFRTSVVSAADLLVFPVLLRDRAAINDLVLTVLGPLEHARGGAGPLLETLRAFFACHGNHAATGRALNLSVRAVTYRLERIHRLTGYAATEATQRFTLEAAVLGARLLDWPAQPIPPP